jgi:hypothetical protein
MTPRLEKRHHVPQLLLRLLSQAGLALVQQRGPLTCEHLLHAAVVVAADNVVHSTGKVLMRHLCLGKLQLRLIAIQIAADVAAEDEVTGKGAMTSQLVRRCWSWCCASTPLQQSQVGRGG